MALTFQDYPRGFLEGIFRVFWEGSGEGGATLVSSWGQSDVYRFITPWNKHKEKAGVT